MVDALRNMLRNFQLNLLNIPKIIVMSKYPRAPKTKVRDKDLVILGNGPSLKEDIVKYKDFLSERDLICVNHFPSTDYYADIKPKFYVTSANDLWMEQIDQHFVENAAVMWNNMVERTDWPLELYIAADARKYSKWKDSVLRNREISINYYNKTPIEGSKWLRHRVFKSGWGMPPPHNVLVTSLYIGINLGYKKIYLLGADHSWLKDISVDDNNNALINQKHFYDRDSSKATTLDKNGKGQRTLYEILYKFMTAFKSYFVLKDYAEFRGAKVLNATKGSYIDAFDRVDPGTIKSNKE